MGWSHFLGLWIISGISSFSNCWRGEIPLSFFFFLNFLIYFTLLCILGDAYLLPFYNNFFRILFTFWENDDLVFHVISFLHYYCYMQKDHLKFNHQLIFSPVSSFGERLQFCGLSSLFCVICIIDFILDWDSSLKISCCLHFFITNAKELMIISFLKK